MCLTCRAALSAQHSAAAAILCAGRACAVRAVPPSGALRAPPAAFPPCPCVQGSAGGLRAPGAALGIAQRGCQASPALTIIKGS